MKPDCVLHYNLSMQALAISLAKAAETLRKHRVGLFGRRPGIILPTWRWWEIRKHVKADWRRYRKSCATRKRRRHYEWVNW